MRDERAKLYPEDPMPAYEAARADGHRSRGTWLIVDCNGYDFLVAADEIKQAAIEAHKSGRVTFAMTHIQYDEILDIPDDKAAKRSAILEIPYVFTPTYGFMLDLSRLGYARLVGDAIEVDRFRSEDRNHSEDALLAATAEFEKAILVTNDDRLTNVAARFGDGVEVWRPERLVEFLRT
ncbi:MAG: hypothetical protein JJE46_00760 [Acidimicrobiia bacterium]|nr:hypothetical protein [Acidimicrobiia bacterium]